MAQNIQLSFLVVLLESVVEFEINILFEINAKWLVGAILWVRYERGMTEISCFLKVKILRNVKK